MTVSFSEYKNQHKTKEEQQLEKLRTEAEQAHEEFSQYLNQQDLKWKNMPKGTEAPGFGLELFSRMGEASRARRAYEAQDEAVNKTGTPKEGRIIRFS